MKPDRHSLKHAPVDPGRSLMDLAGIPNPVPPAQAEKRVNTSWKDAAETLEGLAFGKLDQQDPATRQRLDRRNYLAVPLLLAVAVVGMGVGGYLLFFKTYQAAEKAGERRNRELLGSEASNNGPVPAMPTPSGLPR